MSDHASASAAEQVDVEQQPLSERSPDVASSARSALDLVASAVNIEGREDLEAEAAGLEDVSENAAMSTVTAVELAALVDRIALRASQEQFPNVLPSELTSSEATSEAEHMVQFVRKVGAVQLQSFLDHKYELYRQSCPACISMSEKERRVAYSMEFYYLHVHEFLCGEALRKRFFGHRFEGGTVYPPCLADCAKV